MNIIGPLMFFTLITIYFLLTVNSKTAAFFHDRRSIKDRRGSGSREFIKEKRSNPDRRSVHDRRMILKG